MVMTQLMFKKMDLTLCLNGAIGGLVAIPAGPDLQQHAWAIVIGGIGGALVVIAVPLVDKMKIDDVVGAVAVHGGMGLYSLIMAGRGEASSKRKFVEVEVGTPKAGTSY